VPKAVAFKHSYAIFPVNFKTAWAAAERNADKKRERRMGWQPYAPTQSLVKE